MLKKWGINNYSVFIALKATAYAQIVCIPSISVEI